MNEILLRLTTCATMVGCLASCRSGSSEPVVVPNLNGDWTVTLSLSQSLDGTWTCTMSSEPIINIVQTSDLFNGSTQGGQATCQSTDNLNDVVSFDGYTVQNGVIDPAGNFSFNWNTNEQVIVGSISDDRNSLEGIFNLSITLPPGIAVFFAGPWTAARN